MNYRFAGFAGNHTGERATARTRYTYNLNPNFSDSQREILAKADALLADADTRRDARDFRTAIDEYQEVIAMRRSVYGEYHESVAVALNRLAAVFYKQKRDTDAGELYAQALAIRERVLAPNSAALRISVTNLANVCRNQRRFREAESLYRRALEMREKESGHPNHPQLWNNIAITLEGQGKFDEAHRFTRRAKAYEDSQKSGGL